MDQLDSRIVHSTNMQTDTEPFQIIHAHQLGNDCLLATWLTTRANTSALFPRTDAPYLRQTALSSNSTHSCMVPSCIDVASAASTSYQNTLEGMGGSFLGSCVALKIVVGWIRSYSTSQCASPSLPYSSLIWKNFQSPVCVPCLVWSRMTSSLRWVQNPPRHGGLKNLSMLRSRFRSNFIKGAAPGNT